MVRVSNILFSFELIDRELVMDFLFFFFKPFFSEITNYIIKNLIYVYSISVVCLLDGSSECSSNEEPK